VAIPDRAFAAVVGHFEILCQFRRVLRAERNAHAFQHVHLEKPRKQFLHVHSLFCQCPDVKDSWRKLAHTIRQTVEQGRERDILSREKMTDQEFMQLALEEARACAQAGEVPIGAVLVYRDEVLARGGNRTIRDCDPTAHAEIVVLREAARKLANYRLVETALYVTLEPCAMCAGAIVQARVPRLVYAADDPKGGAFRTCFEILTSPKLNHQVEVTPGVSAEEATSLLQSFFAARR
jgi:tRNA(adenine34) deaminase